MNIEERKNKCIYCENNKKAEHFICSGCGCGMCEDCYNQDLEHTEHLFDFHESIEDEKLYNNVVKITGVSYGYLCFKCLDEIGKGEK